MRIIHLLEGSPEFKIHGYFMSQYTKEELRMWKEYHNKYMEEGPGRSIPLQWRNCDCHKNSIYCDPWYRGLGLDSLEVACMELKYKRNPNIPLYDVQHVYQIEGELYEGIEYEN